MEQPSEAERLLELGANLVGWAPWVELVGYAALVHLWVIQGEEQKAEEILVQMGKMGPQFSYCADAMRALQLVRCDPKNESVLEKASRWAGSMRAHFRGSTAITGIGPFQVDAEYIAYNAWLQVLIATGGAKEALESIQPVIAFAQEKGLVQRVIQLSTLQGLALLEIGEFSNANAILVQALKEGQAEGFVNVFNRGLRFTQWLAGIADMNEMRLSERELEVLRHLVDSRTFAEVARKLYLSPNTLKAHTQNIYSKLDVHSRLEAVNKARELGILPN